MFESMTVYALLNVHRGHISIVDKSGNTLYSSLAEPDIPPDVVPRVVESTRAAGSVLVVTVK